MLHDIAQQFILVSMQPSQTTDQPTPVLIGALIDAFHTLDGLDHLDHGHLEAIVVASRGWTGPVAEFREAVAAAWEMSRPPADPELELIEASHWDCGLIDWGEEDDLEHTAAPLPYGTDPDEVALETGIEQARSGSVAA